MIQSAPDLPTDTEFLRKKFITTQTVAFKFYLCAMKIIYRITDKIWGVSDSPWSSFYAVRIPMIFKLIILGILLYALTIVYPVLYIFGIAYLIKNKKKPNWLYFILYTGLFSLYVYLIIKYIILGYPNPSYSGWPADRKPVVEHPADKTYNPEPSEYSPGEKYEVKTGDLLKDNSSKSINIPDEYNDHLEEYLDDPEDEITYDPEIYDFQND